MENRLTPVMVGRLGQPQVATVINAELSPSSLIIPQSGNATARISGIVYDQFDVLIPHAPLTYTLVSAPQGVTFDASTRTITVPADAQPGVVTIRVQHGNLSTTVTLGVSKPPAVTSIQLGINPPTPIMIPQSGSATATVSGTARDQYNGAMSDAPIEYTLLTAPQGITFDPATRIITVTSDAQPGEVIITAQSGDVSATATLTIYGSPTPSINVNIRANELYTITLRGEGLSSLNTRTFVITYDPALFRLVDFAAQTGTNRVTAGAIAGTPLRILSHANGVITFTFHQIVPSGFTWSGVITMMRFAALGTGVATITVES
jgi:hypothetical protein